MSLKKKILILADDRVGTYSQAEALAQESGLEYEILFLEYNFLTFLPNLFFSQSIIRLKKSSKLKILSLSYCPNYIISAGRRSAPIALYLKNILLKKYNFGSKIIQIMRPEINFNKFDFVIIPKHDEPHPPCPSNLILSLGSLCKNNINLDDNSTFKIIEDFKKPIFSLLIGGSSKKTKFTISSAQKLIDKSLKISQKYNASLIILNSRRTDFEINNFIKKTINKDVVFYDYNLLKNNNPYHKIIRISDLFIISGDSVSMISECCSTGKPVLIFDDLKISSLKHRKFHQNLIENKYAKFFDDNIDDILKFEPLKLQETKRISALIF